MTIISAILDNRMITFTYDGLPRTVEPHALGSTAKGKIVLRGYQPEGETNTQFGWKLFSVDKIENLVVSNDNFAGPREGYKRDDSAMKTIEAQL